MDNYQVPGPNYNGKENDAPGAQNIQFQVHSPSYDHVRYEAHGPSYDNAGYQPQGPAYDNGGYRPQGPSYDNAGNNPQGPPPSRPQGAPYDNPGNHPQGPSYDNAGYRPQGPSYGQQGPSYDNAGYQQQGPTYDNPGNRPQGPTYDNPGNRPQGPIYDNPGNRPQGPTYDNAGNRPQANPYNNPGPGAQGAPYYNAGNRPQGPTYDNAGKGGHGPTYDNAGYQVQNPSYDNTGNQHGDGRPPAYNGLYPRLPQETPSYVAQTSQAVNTQRTTTATTTPRKPRTTAPKRKEPPRCNWRHILCVFLSIAVVVAVVSLILWYFFYYQCFHGRPCHRGGMCLSISKWCNGVQDCPEGEDEASCFRLTGSHSILESYSSPQREWMPVCADDWDNNLGRSVCKQMGYSGSDYVSYRQANGDAVGVKGFMKIKTEEHQTVHANDDNDNDKDNDNDDDHEEGEERHHELHSDSFVQSQLVQSESCSLSAVSLRCIACGESAAAPSSRIVGGTNAVSEAWPWQVSLQINGQHVCGGTIITPLWILSAAHCFHTDPNPGIWTVHYGDVRLSQMTSASNFKTVSKIVNHEDYNPQNNDNDIALLKLTSPLTITSAVKPICLPNPGLVISPAESAWITGWGVLRSNGPSPDQLNQAQVKIYGRKVCNRHDVLDGQVTETMFCAGKLMGGVDTCQGDSGGPLMVKKDGLWWLTGGTSWGIGCARASKPGVYANVTYFVDWVYGQMQDE